MIKIFYLAFVCLLSSAACSQTLLQNAGIIFIKGTADTFYISGNFTNNSSGAVTVKGLLQVKGNTDIQTGSSVTIDTTGVIQMGNALSNTGIFNAAAGTVDMTGTGVQLLPVGSFTNNAVNNLFISNTHAGGVVMNGAVDIYRSLTYSAGGTALATGDSLTFKSSAAQTAWVGNMTGHTISGKATVERYISSHKAWRHLSVPTNTTQSFKNAWQENAATLAENPKPGFGITVTDNRSTWAANGFDFQTAGGPSVKAYDPSTETYVGIPSAYSSMISAAGYMVFIRGDRTVGVSGSATPTVLRTSGPLFVGDLPPVLVPANKFISIGNPYASRIDCRNITKTGVRDFFYVWDPALGGAYGLGAYQVFSNNGSDNYVVTPGGGSYSAPGIISNFIESGQAFFVQGAATGGSVTFKEEAKATGSSLSSFTASLPQASLSLNLLGINTDGTSYTTDGILINFDEANSNAIDDFDAVKMTNSKENISIKKGAIFLTVERRGPVTIGDTVFLKLANTKIQNYRFDLMAQQFGTTTITGYLEDSYLNISSPVSLSGPTSVNFAVTADAASYASNRFRIVFTQAGVLAFRFTDLKAYRENKKNVVNWKTANEEYIDHYTIEISTDGSAFTVLDTVHAHHIYGAAYTSTDTEVLSRDMYYRIRSTDLNGVLTYSRIVKVAMQEATEAISVFPNPISERVMHIQIANEPAGIIEINLINSFGQSVFNASIKHSGQMTAYPVKLAESVIPGVYILETRKKGGLRSAFKVLIL